VLDAALARQLAQIALGHVTSEYPNKLDHVMTGPADVQSPRALHPVFYGSFDWHSCVHGYWLLARLRLRFPALPERSQIDALFDAQLTPEKLALECAYLERPHSGTFERPYGWAWLLMLAAELRSGGGRGPLGARARATCADPCAAPARASAETHLSDPRRHAFQHRVRAGAGARIRQRPRRWRARGAHTRPGARLVPGGCGLPGLGARRG
jgi:hypothetical protein